MDQSAAGRIIAGRYRLIEPVGEGGMATLWKAMDEQLEREVAVKILRPQEIPQSAATRAQLQGPGLSSRNPRGPKS